ncbi:hypothetical protein QE152_g37385 [Popillia japonica]|uniref:Uncharacterized protein n=1 Tax=Popillia japonica TaxID=7064 RepID=A0AAW1IAN9_POPJA
MYQKEKNMRKSGNCEGHVSEREEYKPELSREIPKQTTRYYGRTSTQTSTTLRKVIRCAKRACCKSPQDDIDKDM